MKKRISVSFLSHVCVPEYVMDNLIIKNIPDKVDEEFLGLFIEGKLQLESDDDFSVKLGKNCALLSFNHEYSDEGITCSK